MGHIGLTKTVLSYLKGTKLLLFCPANNTAQMEVFCDVDYAVYLEHKRYITGLLIKIKERTVM